ncbi:MAG TPA: nitrous oxide reductase family maturation protein NosD [Daejeonella sp.]|nr:nitrous oxide reductase family maturation protein NosD [Daejeonella sp.]
MAPATKIASLKQALEIARNGDTILVKKGNYVSENTIINKEVIVKGEGFPVLDARFREEVVTITADNVVFDGFTIKNSKVGSMRDFAGIRLFQVSNVTVSNNKLVNNYFGIYLSEAHHSKVINNQITGTFKLQNSGNGIHLWQCSGNLIRGNQVTGHRDGIYFEFVKKSRIEHNLTEKNGRYGLHFMFSDDDLYQNNTFKNNASGVAVMYSKRITMVNNLFEDNWGSSIYGLLLKDISDSRITGNRFHRNTSGVYMEGTTRILVEKNDFRNNGWGLRILANCDGSTIRTNNFIGNSFDVTTNGSLNLNHFNENYWDKYEGYDLDKDGTGDIPYRPISLFAQIIEKIPQSVMLMRSFIVNLFDKVEKSIPSITPESVKDEKPKMKPWTL